MHPPTPACATAAFHRQTARVPQSFPSLCPDQGSSRAPVPTCQRWQQLILMQRALERDRSMPSCFTHNTHKHTQPVVALRFLFYSCVSESQHGPCSEREIAAPSFATEFRRALAYHCLRCVASFTVILSDQLSPRTPPAFNANFMLLRCIVESLWVSIENEGE